MWPPWGGGVKEADQRGDVQPFVEFMLAALRESLQENQKTVGKTVGKLLVFLKENPTITHEELAHALGLSVRGVEYQLAKLKQEGKV